MATYRIAVLPGDGIGQEVTAEAAKILRAVGRGAGGDFEFEEALSGAAGGGPPVPEEGTGPLRQSSAGQALSDARRRLAAQAFGGGRCGSPRHPRADRRTLLRRAAGGREDRRRDGGCEQERVDERGVRGGGLASLP